MKSRIAVSGGENLANNPFQNIEFGALPAMSANASVPEEAKKTPATAKSAKRGKAHLRIEKSGRGGKTVTVVFGEGIEKLSDEARAALLRTLKNALGVGGTLGVAGTLELQGDERIRGGEWLRAQGFC